MLTQISRWLCGIVAVASAFVFAYGLKGYIQEGAEPQVAQTAERKEGSDIDIEADNSVVTLQQNSTHTSRFIIKNKSSETVHIQHFETSCGCSSARVDSEWIASGGSAKVNYTIKTGLQRGLNSVTFKIFYTTGDDRDGESKPIYGRQVTVRYKVEVEYEIESPASIDGNKESQMSLKVSHPGRDDYVLRVVTSEPCLQVTKLQAKSGETEVLLRYSPAELRELSSSCQVTVYTKSLIEPQRTVAISIRR